MPWLCGIEKTDFCSGRKKGEFRSEIKRGRWRLGADRANAEFKAENDVPRLTDDYSEKYNMQISRATRFYF